MKLVAPPGRDSVLGVAAFFLGLVLAAWAAGAACQCTSDLCRYGVFQQPYQALLKVTHGPFYFGHVCAIGAGACFWYSGIFHEGSTRRRPDLPEDRF